MKLYMYLLAIYFACQLSWAKGSKMVCYYDTYGPKRKGLDKFTSKDMETALQFCSYMIYSHVIITPKTFEVKYLAQPQEQDFHNVAKYKTKYTNIKFLLSLGGRNNEADTENFLNLLDAGAKDQQTFVNSVVNMLLEFKFDGLSLDLQLPTEKPKHQKSYYAEMWSGFVNLFTSNSIEDAKVAQHKRQLSDLIQQLSGKLKSHNLILSLNVLPNIKSKAYLDTYNIIKNVDFIILSAFDFYTPERNPEEADYTAPIYAPIKKGLRLPQNNINQLVNEWTNTLQVPSQKLILGISAFGRSWIMTTASKITGLPPVLVTNGSGPAGPVTHTRGFFSYPEICKHFPKANEKFSAKQQPWTRVEDPTKKYGYYAFKSFENDTGIWISYEDPSMGAAIAEYAIHTKLGGVALFDITVDDLHGSCMNGQAFPILRSIVIKLLQ